MALTHKERRAEQRHALFQRFLRGMRCGEFDYGGGRPQPGQVREHVWDRVCVPGYDEKDGQETEFTLETLTEMVDNFVERGDLIPLDFNHQSNYSHINGQPAPALAFYGALAIVAGGRVVKIGLARGETATGTEDGLDLSKDGLWAYRCQVTPLGQDLLPNFLYVSPTFMSEGTRRDGTKVGYMLAAVAATNTPWQGDTQLTFERDDTTATPDGKPQAVQMRIEQRGDEYVVLPESGDKVLGKHKTKADAEKQLAAIEASKARQHEEEVTMAAGLATCPVCKQRESVNPSTGNFVGHLGKDGKNCPGSGRPAGAVAYEGSAGTAPAQTEEARMAKFQKYAKFAGAAEGADDTAIKAGLGERLGKLAQEAMEDEAFKYEEEASRLEEMAEGLAGEPEMEEMAKKMSKMATSFRKMAKFDADGDNDGDKAAKMEEEKAKMAKLEADKKDKDAEMAAMSATVESLKTRLSKFERQDAEREAQAQAEATRRFEKLATDAVGGGWKGDKQALISFARSNGYDAARSLVETFLPKGAPAHVFDRVTRQGGPIGRGGEAREFAAPKTRVIRSPLGNFVEDDAAFAEKIRAVAESEEPSVKQKVDRLLAAHERPHMFTRLLAAEKIVRAEHPDLADDSASE